MLLGVVVAGECGAHQWFVVFVRRISAGAIDCLLSFVQFHNNLVSEKCILPRLTASGTELEQINYVTIAWPNPFFYNMDVLGDSVTID